MQGLDDRSLEALESGTAGVEDPEAFLVEFDRLAWSTPMDHATTTWSELTSSGHGSLLRDRNLLRRLTRH